MLAFEKRSSNQQRARPVRNATRTRSKSAPEPSLADDPRRALERMTDPKLCDEFEALLACGRNASDDLNPLEPREEK